MTFNVNLITIYSHVLRCFRYAFISVFILFLLDIYTSGFSTIFSYTFVFILGGLVGFVHNAILGKPLALLPLPVIFVAEFIIINFFTFDLLILYFFLTDGPEIWSSWAQIKQTITGPFYTNLIMQVIITSSTVLFYIKIEQLLGDRLFVSYLLGKYSKPRKEKRIFMFIDMKDSTTIGEQLNDYEYYEFINRCFHQMTNPILKTNAEILKYFGDEVIVTWKPKTGLYKSNCLRLFFLIQESLEKKKHEFEEKFGVVPEFRAGIHFGKVISAQVGDIKKSIDFSGDVMNTTSRIQNVCKDLNSNLLISEALYKLLPKSKEDYYKFSEMTNVELRGKDLPINLYHVERIKNKVSLTKG